MRSTLDRLRHVICFELIGLALVTPLGTYVFAMHAFDIGFVALVSSLVATAWNYLYNVGFDRLLWRLRGSTRKSVGLRVMHALLFEAGLIVILVPLFAWYLEIGLWRALVMDLGFAGFYVVYAFIFNWAYDWVFPIDYEALEANR
ncbi:PACE efflux transporter [Amorphus sp. 3PC139-8]|uniref:PACE efflux transporter n=1 Tax=Amorphus sp. 3PC139-8 TaxID=2735676 RepID=UPI00345DF65D